MRLTVRTTVGAGAATALMVGVLAGCSSGSPAAKADATTSPQAAASSSAPTTSQAPAATGGLSKPQLLAALRGGLAHQKSSHVTMDMNTAAGAMSAEGDVSYAKSGTAMRMTMQMPMTGTGKVEMRLVDGVIYMSMPPMTPKGKFLAIDPRRGGGPFGQLNGLGDQMNPLHTFGAFQHGLQSVTYRGKETVDGEQLGHYVLSVRTRAGLKALGQQVPPGVPPTLTYDLWLDAKNLPRKMSMQQSGLSMDMTMSRWGEPVTVTAPPKSAVVTPRTAG